MFSLLVYSDLYLYIKCIVNQAYQWFLVCIVQDYVGEIMCVYSTGSLGLSQTLLLQNYYSFSYLCAVYINFAVANLECLSKTHISSVFIV